MTRRSERQLRDEQEWMELESLLHSEGRFLRPIEFTTIGGIAMHRVLPALDKNYRNSRLLKQFSYDELSLIVGVDEVVYPEIGSKKLDVLLRQAGLYAVSLGSPLGLDTSYGLNREDFLTDPSKRIIAPLELGSWPEEG